MALALVAALLLVGCDGREREEAFKLYGEGRRTLYSYEDTARAESFFLKALEIDPALIQAHDELAYIYMHDTLFLKSNKIFSESRAIHHLRESIRLAPNHIYAHYRLGLITFKKGDFFPALQEFKTTHRLLRGPFGWEPCKEWISLLLYEGFLMLMHGDVPGAEKNFRRSRSLSPTDFRTSLGLVLVASARGDAAAAERHAREANRLGIPLRDMKEPLAFKALLHVWMDRPEQAIATLKGAIANLGLERGTERYQQYQKYLAWAFLKAGRAADAQALAPGRRAEELKPSPAEILTMMSGAW
ncbi:MAG: hypothetical protein J3T61_00925 [Candidatus Brocadiales bacterium]|nr:hypothetical protein [Candidatus Bathyanammoxibius sp.]